MSASPASPHDHHGHAIILRILAVACFALMAAGVKLASDHGAGVVEILFYRNLFSLPLLVVWVALGPGLAGIRVNRASAHMSRGVIGLSSMALNFQAWHMLPLAEATVIGFSAPFFATALSALVLSEAVGRHRWGAIAVGLVGVLVVLQPAGSHVPIAGAAVGIAAAFGIACVTVTLRQIGGTETATATAFWFTLASIVVTGLMMPWFAEPHDPITWAILLWVGVTGGAGQLMNTASLRLAPVSALAPFDYSQLLWATLLGWWIWNTSPTVETWIGAVIIIASGIYIFRREQKRRRIDGASRQNREATVRPTADFD